MEVPENGARVETSTADPSSEETCTDEAAADVTMVETDTDKPSEVPIE